MTIGDSTDLGAVNDRVTLTLGGKDVLIAESYEVHQSFFTQPAAFSIQLGSAETARDIMRRYPANTDFELRVGGVVQFVGKTDGYVAGQGGGTSVHIRGRDNMAPIHDACLRSDTSFSESNFEKLVQKVFTLIPIVGYQLFVDNSANRSRKAGVAVKQIDVPDYLADVLTSIPTQKKVNGKAGERWLHYLKKEFDVAGLFFFAGIDGTFILTAPNAHQSPTYQILRQAGATRNAVNVVSVSFRNETTPRFSECLIIGGGGTGPAGRARYLGRFVDEEMVALGYDRPLVKKSKRVQSQKEGEFRARKLIAQANRAGWQLTYTVSGHTIPSLLGGARAVWTPDTVVQVRDDEFGLDGPYWIEGVTFRSAPTLTEIVLQRPQDLLFGLDDEG